MESVLDGSNCIYSVVVTYFAEDFDQAEMFAGRMMEVLEADEFTISVSEPALVMPLVEVESLD